MSKKLLNPIAPRKLRKIDGAKKVNTSNALYSGIANAHSFLQKPRSSKPWHSNPLKREDECVTYFSQENIEQPPIYHSWKPENSKLITREKYVKSMTKESYMYRTRLISHAVESIATETECCPGLISAASVNKITVKIETAPKPSVPNAVRYVRPVDPMPSARLTSVSTIMTTSVLGQIENKKPVTSNESTSKITTITPNLTTPGRLLNRAQIRNDGSVIRRPPRRLVTNVTQETVLPLSVYG